MEYMPSTYFDEQLPTASHTKGPNMASALHRTSNDPKTRRERDLTEMFNDLRVKQRERDEDYSHSLHRIFTEKAGKQKLDEEYADSLRSIFPEEGYFDFLLSSYAEKTPIPQRHGVERRK
jgi:hypothetical protein